MAKLKKATKDFGDEMIVTGSFGRVLKGYINPKTLSPAKEGVGIAVAVKSFYLPSKEALQDWLVSLNSMIYNTDSYTYVLYVLKNYNCRLP